jgi:hypothetical protein
MIKNAQIFIGRLLSKKGDSDGATNRIVLEYTLPVPIALFFIIEDRDEDPDKGRWRCRSLFQHRDLRTEQIVQGDDSGAIFRLPWSIA